MASINAVFSDVSKSGDRSVGVWQWTPLTEADTCVALDLKDQQADSVQVEGTFGGATLVLNGSNDGTNYEGLHDAGTPATALSFAAKGLKQVLEKTRYLQPSASGGTGQSLTITVRVSRYGQAIRA